MIFTQAVTGLMRECDAQWLTKIKTHTKVLDFGVHTSHCAPFCVVTKKKWTPFISSAGACDLFALQSCTFACKHMASV